MAIGVSPHNKAGRELLRTTWLRWITDRNHHHQQHQEPVAAAAAAVEYRFFTEKKPAAAAELEQEQAVWNDLVYSPLEWTGFGNFGSRGIWQMDWALRERPGMRWFLRVDEDGMLCVPGLMRVLATMPDRRLLWGKYWCRESLARMDENFLLFSRDVVRFLSLAAKDDAVPWDGPSEPGRNVLWVRLGAARVRSRPSSFGTLEQSLHVLLVVPNQRTLRAVPCRPPHARPQLRQPRAADPAHGRRPGDHRRPTPRLRAAGHAAAPPPRAHQVQRRAGEADAQTALGVSDTE